MFSEIEKEYRKGLQEYRWLKHYWPKALVVVGVAIICVVLLGIDAWLIYTLTVVALALLVIYFFAKELYRSSKAYPIIRREKGYFARLQAYFAADDLMRINHLVQDLARHHIQTKDDLQVALDYFQTRLPGNSKANLMEWFLTTVITLSSIIIVTYDDEVGRINMQKLVSAFGTTVIAAIAILTPIIVAKLIKVGITRSRYKTETILVEDLAYIYVNFDQFEEKLKQ